MLWNDLTSKGKVVFGCAVYLGILWLIACLPLISVLLEYRGITICDPKLYASAAPQSLGWFIATLYGGFFIFPLAVGTFASAALLLPLATLVLLARDQRSGIVLVAFYVLTTAAICLFEFYGSSPAIFQVPPEVIAGQSAFVANLSKAHCSDPAVAFAEYRNQLGLMIGGRQSWTGTIYYLGFVALALMLNALFVVFIGFIFFDRAAIKRRAPYLKDVVYYILGYAMFLGAIWCLFRLCYRNDMLALFKYSPPFGGDLAIMAIFAIALAVWVLYFQFKLDELAKTVAQIGQLVVLLGGAAAVHFDRAGTFFGTHASVMNIATLTLLFFFITALVAAFLLRPKK